MIDRRLVFGGTDVVEEFGLRYSSFSEELPRPKTCIAQIPYGTDIDFTDSLGPVSYSSGTQVLVFLLYADTEAERLAKKQRLIGMLHGIRSEYQLSWDDGYTYTGRAVVSINHLDELVDVLTVTITRDPYKVSGRNTVLQPTPQPVTGGVYLHYDISSDAQTDITITHTDAFTLSVDGTTINSYTAKQTAEQLTFGSVYGNDLVVYLTSNADSWWSFANSKLSTKGTYEDNNIDMGAWGLEGHDLAFTGLTVVANERRSI